MDTQHRFSKRFGMPFSFERKPRMAGTRARAARSSPHARCDPQLGEAALRALQLLQFTTPRVLDDDDDLRAVLATVPGLDADAIVDRIDDPELVELYEADRARARSAEGTPTHVQDRHATSDGPVRYTAPSVIFEQDGRSLEVGGFQPFEAYDTALANLDPALTRRPAPADVLEALAEFPEGLVTAELASVMRPSDLADADLEADRGAARRSSRRSSRGHPRAGRRGRHLASRSGRSGLGPRARGLHRSRRQPAAGRQRLGRRCPLARGPRGSRPRTRRPLRWCPRPGRPAPPPPAAPPRRRSTARRPGRA